MKKSNSIIIAIVALIVVIGGGYAIFHKSPTPATTTPASKAASAPAVNNSVLTTKTGSSLGQYLAAPSGKALYTYGADTSGVSNCTGSCLAAWPAYQDTNSSTNFPAGVGTIKRTDNGQAQYTYNGMPLYYFASDGSGQPTGNGVSNFTLAKPAAAASSSSSTSTQSSSTPASSTPAAAGGNTSSGSGYPY